MVPYLVTTCRASPWTTVTRELMARVPVVNILSLEHANQSGTSGWLAS